MWCLDMSLIIIFLLAKFAFEIYVAIYNIKVWKQEKIGGTLHS